MTLLRRLPPRSSLAVVVLAGLVVLRPGLLRTSLTSPRAWAAMAAVLLIGVAVRSALHRTPLRRAARPAATACTAVLVGLLIAPSFQQRTLQEPLPALVAARPGPGTAASATASSGAAPAQDTGAAAPEAAPLQPADVEPAAPETVADRAVVLLGNGQLEGIDHRAHGTVRLHEVDGAGVVAFAAIDVEGTVGPSVHLVPRGSRTPHGGVRLGPLEAERGSFTTAVPAGADLRRDWSLLIWCDPFDVPIAVADLG